jgi:hypothetical protein
MASPVNSLFKLANSYGLLQILEAVEIQAEVESGLFFY